MNKFGLPQRAMDEMHAIFAKHNKVKKVMLYGSRAIGNYKNGSDIDLTMCGSALTFDDLNNIAGELEESSIPYLVDLSIFDVLDHAKLKDHIKRNGRVFYDRYAGWKAVKLGDVCRFVRGPFGGSLKKSYFVETGYAVYEQQHAIKNQCENFRYFVTQEKFDEMSRFAVSVGDILMSCSGTIGKTTIVPKGMPKGIINQALLKITPHEALHVRFLKFYMESKLFAEQLMNTVDGAAIQNVASVKVLKEISITIPPLAEQQRIVAKLDAAFAEIDTAIETVETNLANTKALINSLLGEIFDKEKEQWDTYTLNDLCVVERGSSPRPIKNFITEEGGVNWVKIGDTSQDGKYVTSTRQRITKKGAEKSRYVNIGDFILTNSMSYGRPYIMAIDGYIHDGWFVLRLNGDIDVEYFFYLLSSPLVQSQFKQLAAGAVVKNISGDLVKKTIIPLAPKKRQIEIREKIVAIEEKTEESCRLQTLKIKNLLALKSSILAQELQGETT